MIRRNFLLWLGVIIFVSDVISIFGLRPWWLMLLNALMLAYSLPMAWVVNLLTKEGRCRDAVLREVAKYGPMGGEQR